MAAAPVQSCVFENPWIQLRFKAPPPRDRRESSALVEKDDEGFLHNRFFAGNVMVANHLKADVTRQGSDADVGVRVVNQSAGAVDCFPIYGNFVLDGINGEVGFFERSLQCVSQLVQVLVAEPVELFRFAGDGDDVHDPGQPVANAHGLESFDVFENIYYGLILKNGVCLRQGLTQAVLIKLSDFIKKRSVGCR